MTAAQPSAILTARYARAFDAAAIIIVAGWHVAGAGSLLLAHLPSYRSGAIQAGGWLVLAVAIAAGSARLLRGATGPAVSWAIAALALAVSTAAALGCPPGRLLETDWAWGTAGWIALLALLRRPLRELGVFLAAEALATLGVLLLDDPHRLAIAGFITVLGGSASIQLAAAVGARALGATARQAADAAASQAAASAQQLIAESVHTARRSRWLTLDETLGQLLTGLATGTADPGDETVRRGCAVEAARLRRLLAESDESPDPLVHELHACADVAERRGVAVDIESLGTVPAVPPEIRRAITDLAIAALAPAASRARITVDADGAGLAVSVVTDAPEVPPPPAAPGLAVASQRDGTNLWLEARWNR